MIPFRSRLRRLLGSRRLIVAEALVLVALGAIGAIVPQKSSTTTRELARFARDHPVAAPVIEVLGLDRIFSGWPFLIALALATASLVLVTHDQWRQLLRTWRRPLTAGSFARARYRIDFERPATEASSGEPRARFESRGRAGLWGPPLFHLGILVMIAAGSMRALFGVDAVVDLIEGETLETSAAAYGAQWPAPLAGPVSLKVPVRFEELQVERYPSDKLRRLSARVGVAKESGFEEALAAVNTPLRIGASHLYLSSFWGPAAMLELSGPEGVERVAALLQRRRGSVYETEVSLIRGMKGRLRGTVTGPAADLPAVLEARVLETGALLYAGALSVDQPVDLGEGRSLRLAAVLRWARFRATRDLSTWPAYLGFVLSIVGATLIFAVVRVDTAVVVTPAGDRERVLVALKADRFEPLYAERFAAMVEKEGGPSVVA